MWQVLLRILIVGAAVGTMVFVVRSISSEWRSRNLFTDVKHRPRIPYSRVGVFGLLNLIILTLIGLIGEHFHIWSISGHLRFFFFCGLSIFVICKFYDLFKSGEY